jgi:hypothetical protein
MSSIKDECNQEINNLVDFAVSHQTPSVTEAIFRTSQADSYFVDSSKEQKLPGDRIMEYGFANPMQLEKLLKLVWGEDEELEELIPTVKVATFKMKDQYDNKFKDLSLYNYTL